MTPQAYLSTYHPTEASPALKSAQQDARVRYVKCFVRQRVREDVKDEKVGADRQPAQTDSKTDRTKEFRRTPHMTSLAYLDVAEAGLTFEST